MTKVIKVAEPGDQARLELTEIELAGPAAGEIRLAQQAIGVNFIDIYHRRGLYPLPAPGIIGVEAVGRVTALGTGVTGLAIGDRVVYGGAVGAYASERNLPAWRAVRLPETISDGSAAAGFMKAMTVQMLMRRVYAVKPGDWVLVTAAAGGVGSLLCQWAKRAGATVIGTVSSEEKAALARSLGADHVIIGRDADIVAEVAKLTEGKLAHAAYDGIGGTTLAKTFACVRPFGTVVSIGAAAGPIPPIQVDELGPKRSLIFARPSVMGYSTDPATYQEAAAETIAALESGLQPTLDRRYPLDEAAAAQAALEQGLNRGSLILEV